MSMTQATTSQVSRRTLAAGIAWATPAILLASAAPAMAASTDCLTLSTNPCHEPNRIESPNDPNVGFYRYKIALFADVAEQCLARSWIIVHTIKADGQPFPQTDVRVDPPGGQNLTAYFDFAAAEVDITYTVHNDAGNVSETKTYNHSWGICMV